MVFAFLLTLIPTIHIRLVERRLKCMSAQTEIRGTILSKLKDLTPAFQSRESELDKLNSFPYQNIKDLKEIGYTALTLPKDLGGGGIKPDRFP